MRVLVAAATALDHVFLCRAAEEAGLSVTAGSCVTAGPGGEPPGREELAAAVASCDAVLVSPCGAGLAAVLRVAGVAEQLGVPVLDVRPPGATGAAGAVRLGDHLIEPGPLPGAAKVLHDAVATHGRGSHDPHPATTTPEFVVPYSWEGHGQGELRFGPGELARALLTTGRARSGRPATAEWLHRAATAMMYATPGSCGFLTRSSLSRRQARTGMAHAAGTLAEALLSVFAHSRLDGALLQHAARLTDAGSTALIGRTARGWLVAEARGRTRLRGPAPVPPPPHTIAGRAPDLLLGAVAAFPPEGARLLLRTVEPDGPPGDLPIDEEAFLRAYYLPVADALDAGDPLLRAPGTITSRFPGLDLTLRLSHELYRAVRRGGPLRGVPDGLAVEPWSAGVRQPEGRGPDAGEDSGQ